MSVAVLRSVNVDRNDVNHRSDDHHEDQWYVQRMPQREQPLVPLEAGHATARREATVDVGARDRLQVLALGCHHR